MQCYVETHAMLYEFSVPQTLPDLFPTQAVLIPCVQVQLYADNPLQELLLLLVSSYQNLCKAVLHTSACAGGVTVILEEALALS